MAKVIHNVPHLITPINGVDFTALEREQGGSISAEISDEVAQNFLLVPTFELYIDPAAQQAPAPAKPTQETAAQRKARVAAEEKAAKEKAAAEQAEADRLAAEQQQSTEQQQAEPSTEQSGAGGEPQPETGNDEVF